jgi:hypothetical protein
MTKRKTPSKEQVGYGKPPKHSQFKKGQVANPTGRPKGAGGLSGIDKAFSQPVTITVDGKRRRVPATEAIATQLVGAAIKGDKNASKLVLQLNNQRERARQGAAASAPPPRPPGPNLPKIVFSVHPQEALQLLGITIGTHEIQTLSAWVVEAALDKMTLEELAELPFETLKHDLEDPEALESYLAARNQPPNECQPHSDSAGPDSSAPLSPS